MEFRKKKKLKKIFYSPVILVILIVVFMILLKSVFGAYQKERLSSENLDKEKIELEKLSLRQKTLADSIEFLKTDQGVENEIRSKFRAVKEGERIAVIIDDNTKSTTTISMVQKDGIIKKIIKIIQRII